MIFVVVERTSVFRRRSVHLLTFHFKNCSSLLGQFQPNLAQSIFGWRKFNEWIDLPIYLFLVKDSILRPLVLYLQLDFNDLEIHHYYKWIVNWPELTVFVICLSNTEKPSFPRNILLHNTSFSLFLNEFSAFSLFVYSKTKKWISLKYHIFGDYVAFRFDCFVDIKLYALKILPYFHNRQIAR